MWIDGRKVAESPVEQPLFATWEGLDIGRDLVTPVSKNYQSPFEFSGTLKKVVFALR